MTRDNGYQGPAPVARCDTHGKGLYTSRKRAKEAAKKAWPGHKFDAYECDVNEGFYHYGHQSKKITRGHMPRALLRPGVTLSR